MRRLLMMRHAKSSWKDPSLADFDRPLNRRGRRDAVRAAQWLIQQEAIPDRVVSSAAQRARQTAELLVGGLKQPVPIETTPQLYHAAPEMYTQWAAETDDDVQTLLMIGHNPGVAQWLADWTGLDQHVPTAAIACVTLQGASWYDAMMAREASLDWYWYPKL